MDEWTDPLMDKRAARPPACGWAGGLARCRATAVWQVRCTPRRADSGRGSWPGDVDVVRACATHLDALTRGRRVLGPPMPLGDVGRQD